MNRSAIDRIRNLLDEGQQCCNAGLFNQSSRRCLLDVSAVLREIRQTVENELATEDCTCGKCAGCKGETA